MNSPLIVAQDIGKSFNKVTALDGVHFSVEEGQIFGFLGPSGSGKTTTINILTGQVKPDKGHSYILGQNSRELKRQTLAKVGLVSDNSGFYEKMSLYHNLLFYGKYYGKDKKTIDDLLKQVGLYDSRKTIADKLSTGMKQRMLLARALINQPRVLFLDEPTSGLDPATSQTIHSLILDLKKAGTAIFLTTHDMNEATLLCDQLALLNEGRLVEEGSPQFLIQKYNQHKQVKLTYQEGTEKVLPFSELGQVMTDDSDQIIAIHSCEPSLEDIFIQLTGGKLNA